ncbi:MAG: 3-hydroxyacyl-ACP dehydratase FabZ family protein, partial [Phycisphaeraceae bacterium]
TITLSGLLVGVRRGSADRGNTLKFDLIDRVTRRDEASLSAVKNVSAAEEYLGDHFPGFPILPGVMMLETLVQAARHFTSNIADPPPRPLVISQVRNVKYAGMVRPGQTLEVTVTLRKRDGQAYDFQGVGKVGDQVAVQGRFSLAPLSDPFEQVA